MGLYAYLSLTSQATLDYRERTNEVPLRVKKRKPINFREPVPNEKIINVPQIKQEQSNWCWAACAEMVFCYYGVTPARQCDFANELFGRTECCSDPSSPNCNQPCEIENLSNLYSRKGINSRFLGETVPFSKLQSEINADRPVEVVFYQKSKKRGHLIIVRGWRITGTEKFVHVNDPKDSDGASRIVTYSELLHAYKEGKWTDTWIEIRS